MHDLWPAIRTGISNVFRFSGRMNRTHFWLWIGFLYVAGTILPLLDMHLIGGTWPRQPLSEVWWYKFLIDPFQRHPVAGLVSTDLFAAWPRGLTLTVPLQEYMFYGRISGAVFPLVYLLSLSATIRRARDAGYSPLLTLLMLYWFVFGGALVMAAMYLLAGISEAFSMIMFIAGMYYLVVHWAVSLICVVVALYWLAAPSAFEQESP